MRVDGEQWMANRSVVAEPLVAGFAEMYILMYSTGMLKRYSIAEARRNLPSLVDEAESGSEVELTRRGKAVAVVVSVEAYERLKLQRGSFGEAYKAFREKYPSSRVAGGEALGPKYFRWLRDKTRGRKVEL